MGKMKNEVHNVVMFWRCHEPSGEFSQWHLSSFMEGDLKYICAEQYMMYHKAILFEDQAMAQKILKTTKPRQMKKYGRQVSNFNQAVWAAKSYDIVLQGTRLKFSQNDDATIAEGSPVDAVWGVGTKHSDPRKWKGLNLLGKALMQVRSELLS
eukprot:TRINITY_DN7598_c0_g1::TRINITY_DN7598_c0_g1_i1::g.1967::m.1967 TRINITY_DN7598_c0_g1::TRINITY_DN7598_c0_g1_i1::g.1967  ORF type:complete len:153 (+),score=-0.08,sp/Q5UR67/RIBX_MIMIV/42.47/2e-30,DUF1768/PF08719.6/1e-41 TRINITY_DN7598_c0_g1_i1:3-461(+)